jgi:hypothetical protein
MPLSARIASLVARIAAEFKAVRSEPVPMAQVQGLFDWLDDYAFADELAQVRDNVLTLSGTVTGKLDAAQFNALFDARLATSALAITNTSVVASQPAMLALVAQTGDVAVRTDVSKTFILAANDPTVLANWVEVLTPAGGGGAVLSVNGLSGTVVLTSTNIAEGTNLYHTVGRVRGTNLTSYAVAGARTALATNDSIEGAFGKIGKWLTDLSALAFSGAAADLAGTKTSAFISDFNAAVDARISNSAIAVTDTFVVASQAAMLALTAQTGDVAVRTDINKSFILRVNDPAVLANWQELLTPAGGTVLSVNGSTGAVVLTTTDITEGSNLYHTPARVRGVNLTGVGTAAVKSSILATDTVEGAFTKINKWLQRLSSNRIARWRAAGSTTVTAVEAAGLTATGTATGINPTSTNAYTQATRVEYLVTVAAATAVAGWRLSSGLWWRGNAPGLGGFRFECIWGTATGMTTATHRAFVGMANILTAPTDVEPSSLVNIIGMGWDAADANIQIMHNDATGVATKIDLGASFPVPVVDRAATYDVELACTPNGADVVYRVTDLLTNAVATGTISTDLPASTLFLAPRGWASVGGTSSVIGIALRVCEIESDY